MPFYSRRLSSVYRVIGSATASLALLAAVSACSPGPSDEDSKGSNGKGSEKSSLEVESAQLAPEDLCEVLPNVLLEKLLDPSGRDEVSDAARSDSSPLEQQPRDEVSMDCSWNVVDLKDRERRKLSIYLKISDQPQEEFVFSVGNDAETVPGVGEKAVIEFDGRSSYYASNLSSFEGRYGIYVRYFGVNIDTRESIYDRSELRESATNVSKRLLGELKSMN
ncbi:hypothetical protein NOGI109294_20280 [Nocardiopsis gilva]|uniref:hypothetical protein n=1 Tax=Nocardiopsis gilva TaxID=280236 RepID=UPI001267877F|nr:hypothetical protein [Nocardiopsis gilva]